MIRTLKISDWHRSMRESVLDRSTDVFERIAGLPASNVAKKLKLSEQRVNALIREGTLDAIHLVNAADRVVLTVIPDASVERYLAHRVPDRGRQGYFAFPSA